MSEFEKALQEYRKLVEQVADERGFLDFLEDQLRQSEKRLKALVMTYPQIEGRPDVSRKGTTPPLTLATPSEDDSALQEAARAVEELGDGVTAQKLAKHLGITRDAARLRLQRASRAGLLVRMAIGRYRAIKRKPAETVTTARENGALFRKVDGSEVDSPEPSRRA